MITLPFSLLCTSIGAEIATLGSTCQNLGEIQRVGFQRIFSSGSTKNSFSTSNGLLKTNWETAIAADDGTKITLSSSLYGEEKILPGGPREDPATLGGVAAIIGSEPTAFEAILKREHQKWIERLATYSSENLGVWLFDEHGQVGCLVDDQDSPTAYYPIPIAPNSFFVGDPKTGNYNSLQENMLMWKFLPNWGRKFVTFLPTDFNPVLDLANASS